MTETWEKESPVHLTWHYGLPVLELGEGRYAVAVSQEAAEKAAIKAIKEELETFNWDYINDCLSMGLGEMATLELAEITALELFARNAIARDGAACFLACYDEKELTPSQFSEEEQEIIRKVAPHKNTKLYRIG